MKEKWKDIPGYEGRYRISSEGRIESLLTGCIRKDVQAGRGYRAIQLSDKYHKKHRFYVHRLVAYAFLGAPPFERAQINHRNLDKTDNSVTNLEWVSPEENMRHAYQNGATDYRRPIRSDNKTGHKGIVRHSGGFAVSFCGEYVGWYKSLNLAVEARKKAEGKYENERAISGY